MHIGWKSWKLIARTIISTSSLFVAQRPSTYSQGNIGNYENTRGGVGKSVLEHNSGNISETRIGKLTGCPTGTHQRSFERHHPQPPTASSFPRLGVRNPTRNSAVISGTGKATNFKFCTRIHSINRKKSPLKFGEK